MSGAVECFFSETFPKNINEPINYLFKTVGMVQGALKKVLKNISSIKCISEHIQEI